MSVTTPVTQGGRRASLRPEWIVGALFLAPAFLIYVTIIVYPLVYSSWLSLFDWDGISPTKRFVGFENYVTLWTSNRVFWIALKNNALWTAVALVVPTALGLGLALLLNGKLVARGFWRGIFYFPAILSLSICGLIWTWIYHPTLGFLNQFLEWVGLENLQRAWLSEPSIALFAVMVAAAWHNTGCSISPACRPSRARSSRPPRSTAPAASSASAS